MAASHKKALLEPRIGSCDFRALVQWRVVIFLFMLPSSFQLVSVDSTAISEYVKNAFFFFSSLMALLWLCRGYGQVHLVAYCISSEILLNETK